MGGKTQQRVAGNKKPSNSDRIRQLLIEKTGNDKFITFSALSSANTTLKQPEPSQNPFLVASKKSDDKLSVEVTDDSNYSKASVSTPEEKSNNPQAASSSPTKSAQSLNEPRTITKLVVKKVGGRDCFTRVKVTLPEPSLAPEPDIINNELAIKSDRFDRNQPEQTVLDQSDENDSEQEEEPLCSDHDLYDEEPGDAPADLESLLDGINQIPTAESSYQSLDEMPDDVLANEEKLIKLLRLMVEHYHKELSIEEWDLVVRNIYKFIGLISRSENILTASKSEASLCIRVLQFINQLTILAKSYKSLSDGNAESEFPMLQSLLDDWNNFHLSNMYQDLTILFFKFANLVDQQQQTMEKSNILKYLANIIMEEDAKLMIMSPSLTDFKGSDDRVEPDFELPENCRFVAFDVSKFRGFQAICNLLNRNDRSFSILAHAMLSKTMGILCDDTKDNSSDLEDISLLPPEALFTILVAKDSVMSALLSDYRVGQVSVAFESNTDSYTCALSYLLTFDLVIQYILKSRNQLKHNMIHSLKRMNLIQRLLDNLFILLPPPVDRNSLTLDKRSWSLSDFLKNPLSLSLTNRPHNEIELISLHLYFSIACHMPITVRKWYNNNSNRRLCNLVQEYTVKHISKVICSLEMESVTAECRNRADENLIIKARPSANEVYAFYSGDEFKVELTIKLPDNYPLGPVQIDGGKRIGVTDVKKWRNWLLQLTKFLAHQNGPILDGIDLWRRNIDKGVEGVEKCMICFSILHSNYQLPKKKCKTCSKMFHHFCISKWFVSSRNTTCPLCRNIW